MAISAAITTTQGADKTTFTINDVTPYAGGDSKSNFSARTLIIYKNTGAVYRQPGQVVDTIDFSYGTYPGDSITITGLDKDYAFTIIMTITPIVPVSGSIYTVTVKTALTGYTISAERERWKKSADDPRLEKNQDYLSDTFRLLVERDNAVVAAAANDITSAQLALDRAGKIISLNKLPY